MFLFIKYNFSFVNFFLPLYTVPDQNCPICLKDFDQDDVYVDLPCKHRFHSECVVPWLKKVKEQLLSIILGDGKIY